MRKFLLWTAFAVAGSAVVLQCQSIPGAPLRTWPATTAEWVTFEDVGVVGSNVISLTLADGRVLHGRQVPYQKQPGDAVEVPGGGQNLHRWVKRQGRAIGALVGTRGDVVQQFDQIEGGHFPMDWSRDPAAFQVSSQDDDRFTTPVQPSSVGRKSYPTDIARLDQYWTVDAAVRHVLYLKLPHALAKGRSYRIAFRGDLLPAQEVRYDPDNRRSEAVHVSHLGFRPDDPAKVGFLSTWMGTGGGLAYDAPKFALRRADGGKVVFSGVAALAKAGRDATEDAYNRNYNGTDVYLLDFSAFGTPGSYRVCVEAIGCSYSFRIADDVWKRAFAVSARGLYHQRSGIPIGPPYTTFERPRTFHPDDGMKIRQAGVSLIDTFNGSEQSPSAAFEKLPRTATDQVVPGAWGGWMDAGDFDRHALHLVATRYLIDLAELNPALFDKLDLNIPESGNRIPDVVDEALFNLALYRRLQHEDGGVSGGIESFQHPRFGEASWQESLDVAVYGPGVFSSYLYAGAAAKAAAYLKALAPAMSQDYRTSAVRAMDWAEARSDEVAHYHHIVADARNLAAAELYQLTSSKRWHDLFLATTKFTDPKSDIRTWQSHDQSEAAWVYARTNHVSVDARVKQNAVNALLREAQAKVDHAKKTGFRWTKFPYAPPYLFPIPNGIELARAHYLTKKASYLEALVLSAQFGAGANPLNLVFTTGLGHRSPVNPLQVDHRLSHQPVPPGITVFGPLHNSLAAFTPSYNVLVRPFAVPAEFRDWPGVESYWDIFWFVGMNEYTIHQTMAPNLYVWGYLAAR